MDNSTLHVTLVYVHTKNERVESGWKLGHLQERVGRGIECHHIYLIHIAENISIFLVYMTIYTTRKEGNPDH